MCLYLHDNNIKRIVGFFIWDNYFIMKQSDNKNIENIFLGPLKKCCPFPSISMILLPGGDISYVINLNDTKI